jgi:hypothetical protein
MDRSVEKYYCEDCEKFNETEIPADCLSGHGKVAFRHNVCSDFVKKDKTLNIQSEGEES